MADDEPIARGAIRAVLTRRGYECQEAASATEVFELLDQGEFDLILADICMPGNSGLEMVQRLTELPQPIPVVLLTGQPSVETAALAVKLRVIGYLIKPADTDEVWRMAQIGVDSAQALRLLRQHRERFELLMEEMRRTERLGHSAPDKVLGSCISLSMQHLLVSINDLRNLVEMVAARDEPEAARLRLASSRPFLLLDAMRETIRVLERTKTSFKSRELAELRHKLESLLGSEAELPAARK